MKQIKTFSISEEAIKLLKKLAFTSKRTQSALLEEAIQLLVSNPGGNK